jgi:hypothetical protein
LKADEAAGFLGRIEAEYEITDAAGTIYLGQAREALARLRQAQAIVDAEAIVIRDRFGQAKQIPASRTERDARNQPMTALAALHLDLEPLRDRPGRPPGK